MRICLMLGVRGILFFLVFSFSNAFASSQTFQLTPFSGTVSYDKSFDNADDYRSDLIRTGDLYMLKTHNNHQALLVIEKNYLDQTEVTNVASEIANALDQVPLFVQRPLIEKNIVTYYIFSEQGIGANIFSYTAPIGSSFGTYGVMLKFVKEKSSPIFHETAHLTQPLSPLLPNSLSEGLADYVQEHFRPGLPYGFVPANVDVDVIAKKLLLFYSAAPLFYQTIGSDAAEWPQLQNPSQDMSGIDALYFASDSFTNFLIKNFGLEKAVENLEAGSTDAAYEKIYNTTLSDLRTEWASQLK